MLFLIIWATPISVSGYLLNSRSVQLDLEVDSKVGFWVARPEATLEC